MIKELINEDKNWGNGIDGRIDFNESWLYEEPEHEEVGEVFSQLQSDIQELKKIEPEKIEYLDNNLFKLEYPNGVYYWIEKNNEIAIATSLDKKLYADIIVLTGKNSKLSNRPPYADDLYLLILNDLRGTGRSLVVSDKKLSNSGYNIWKRLFAAGHKVSIYDPKNPGKTYTRFDSENEVKKYFGSGRDYQQYRYVLSESRNAQIDIMPCFLTRRIREKNRLQLD